MNPQPRLLRSVRIALALAGALTFLGCASSGEKSSSSTSAGGSATPSAKGSRKFRADDGRTIDIGTAVAADGGQRYNNPHMEKGQCWVANGFNFTGFDTLYIAPTLSTAKFNQQNAEEAMVHKLAQERLVTEIESSIKGKGLFAQVVTREADIKPGAKTLKLENTITEFTKGGGAARYFVGLYGGGQPILRVRGKASEGDKSLFTFEARRSGVSAGARVGGVFMKDEDIQIEDIRSLVLDLTDFMAAVGGKYPAAP